jgi:hypothetical protein
MERCVDIAKDNGLKKAYWSGHTGLPGKTIAAEMKIKAKYSSDNAWLSGSYAFCAGCKTHPRECASCRFSQDCQIKRYIPDRVT